MSPSLAFSYIGSVTARHSSSGRQPNFAALNTGCHLYSTGRPSRWALAHILVWFVHVHLVLVRYAPVFLEQRLIVLSLSRYKYRGEHLLCGQQVVDSLDLFTPCRQVTGCATSTAPSTRYATRCATATFVAPTGASSPVAGAASLGAVIRITAASVRHLPRPSQLSAGAIISVVDRPCNGVSRELTTDARGMDSLITVASLLSLRSPCPGLRRHSGINGERRWRIQTQTQIFIDSLAA